MSNIKNLVLELTEMVEKMISEEGEDVVRKIYNAPSGVSSDELVEFCVGVEYQNAFK